MFLIHPDIYYRHDHTVQLDYELAEPDLELEEESSHSNSRSGSANS